MKIYPSLTKARKNGTKNNILDSKMHAASGSLIDRLMMDDEDIEVPNSSFTIDGVLNSIKRNLSRTLNIHAGSAVSNVEIGMPDFNHSTVSSLDVSVHLIEAIRRCIEVAEPRLKNIEVKSNSDVHSAMDLDFLITADLSVSTEEEQIRIDIAMRDGHFFPQ
ncbi:type VI secretion system baseplate subunit TssE [uncultured Bartonella sp.]|uniref:type VI secretion system baseplate subunit TssE n=1 Tax=uncultured Bartonella sp. TaxID=104108 RepID=UPI00262148A5|nr:type VI secretion system baseplate subunit TssE [uncultured Bartonella sp.]